MYAKITKHQLSQIFHYLKREYSVFGTVRENNRVSFAEMKSVDSLVVPTPKTPISFKSILWPDGRLSHEKDERKIAFFGLTNCDVRALIIFLREFADYNFITKKILIVSSTCDQDADCFCTALVDGQIRPYDLHLQSDGDGYKIFPGSDKGRAILKANEVKTTGRGLPEKIVLDVEKIDPKKLGQSIEDKAGHLKFWQRLSDNCFGCGACSTVCPLCSCTRQEFVNEPSGDCHQCQRLDSCFADGFAKLAGNHDLRPQNRERIYNWYHHKFVRAPFANKQILCTGCGRCITACPANLNQRQIMQSIQKVASDQGDQEQGMGDE